MTKPELEAFVDILAQQAQETFRKDGHHAPIAFVLTPPDKCDIVLLKVDTPRERRAAFTLFCLQGAHAIAFVTEAWLGVGKLGPDAEAIREWTRAGRSIEHLPGRIEALVLMGACPEGELLRSWQIHRVGGKPTRLEFMPEADIGGGILTGLPWR